MAHLCKTSSKECDHICIPLWNRDKAITKCLCAAGYQLNENNKCVKQLSPKFLLLAQSKPAMIKGIDVYYYNNRSNDLLALAGLKEPRHFDYDLQTNTVVYFDSKRKAIESISLNDTKKRNVLLNQIYCSGLAIDWIGHNLYFIDGIRRSVKVMNLNNSTKIKTIISNFFNDLPTSIALDPQNGLMYIAVWSDTSPMRGAIYSSKMNGSALRQYYSQDVHWPIGLSINYKTKRLYWCDQHKQTIESADFNGNNRVVELEELGQPTALALGDDTNEYFVFNHIEGAIKHWKNKTLFNTINKIISSNIFDIKLYDPNTRKVFSNPCSTLKCDDLCLLTSNNTATCSCRDGHALTNNNQCVQKVIDFQAPSLCSEGDFKCANQMLCISKIHVCDGEQHCSDGSDESILSNGPCANFSCPENTFRCDQTKCIPNTWLCDSQKDCKDNTDEEPSKCMKKLCKENEFQCKISKKCIPAVWKCDLSHDCGLGDFSDEADCGEFLSSSILSYSKFKTTSSFFIV